MPFADNDDTRVRVTVPLRETKGVLEGDGDGDSLELRRGDALPETEAVDRRDALGERVLVRVTEGDVVALRKRDGVTLSDTLAEGEREPGAGEGLDEVLDNGERDGDKEALAEREALGEPDSIPEFDGDRDGDIDAETLPVIDALAAGVLHAQ